MEDKNKITVIMPIYNAELYLTDSIESILRQTYADLQIILVDDGSTDISGKICDDYAKRDRRIEVCHTENKGLVAARKLGISRALGGYIGFVDADDYIERDMYEYLHKNITESHADFIHTGYIEENSGKNKDIYGFENGIYDLKSMEERIDFLCKYMLYAGPDQAISPSIWSKLFKKELLEKSYLPLPDEQQYGEDVLCLCLSILLSERIMLRKRAFYHYTIRQMSISHLDDIDCFMQETTLNYNVMKVIQNYDSLCYMKLKRDICCFIGNRILGNINRINKGFVCMTKHYFRDIGMLRGKKVALYGAGIVGQNYYSQFCKYRDIEIVAWFDSDWKSCQFDYADVVDGTSKVVEYEFDKMIIAVLEKAVALEIRETLKKGGLPEGKIIWQEPENVLDIKMNCSKGCLKV